MNMPRTSRRQSLWSRVRSAAGLTGLRSRRAARLARLAGHGLGEEAFQTLEQRQLLFALTIQPDSVNPATGLGTATATFAYVIPYLFKELPAADAGMPETVVEEFADEMAGWTGQNPPVPPNGTLFAQSDFQISYRTQANNAVRLLFPTMPGVADGGAQGAQDRDLGLTLQGSDQVTFSFRDGAMNGQPGEPRLTTNVAFTVRAGPGQAGVYDSDGDGIKTTLDGTRVELLLDGVVVRTLLGAQLAGFGTVLNGLGDVAFNIPIGTGNGPGFDSFRFSSANQNDTSAYADAFIIDDIATTFPSTRFKEFIESRVFAATVTFVGPAGATATFLDLYGDDMRQTLDLAAPMGGNGTPRVDRNGDGVPDFNDGFGAVVITGANAQSSISIVGGTVDDMGVFELPMDPFGIGDDFEMTGFGYDTTNTNPPMVIGLAPASGSVIIGSPFVRDRSSPEAYLGDPHGGENDTFLRFNQGIFVNGTSFGSVSVHGIVHGSSRFEGSLARYNVVNQPGSVSVQGDVGEFIVASDAGQWESDDGSSSVRLGSLLTIGRTIRELAVGGRNAMNVQVLADINNPARPAISFIDYFEREVIYGIDPAVQDGPRVTLNVTVGGSENWNNRQTSLGQAAYFGSGYFRNDGLASSEYIGYNGTAVRVRGFLGAQDPVSQTEDASDVFAFATDSSREVVIQAAPGVGQNATLDYVRIVDRRGIVVAAFDGGGAGRGPGGNAGQSPVLRFRPDSADVYYLVLNAGPDGGEGVNAAYDLLISGMAPTTAGAIRSGAGNANLVLTVNAGNLGSLRMGTGFIDGMAMEAPASAVINTGATVDEVYQWGASTISVPGNLYNVFVGGDIDGSTLLVGRDLGTLVTAGSPVFQGSVVQGDVFNADIRAGRRIGVLDIQGGMGVDQDPDPDSRRPGVVSIRSGTAGGNGNIGSILVGAYVIGENVSIVTSQGSTIDQFLVGNLNGGAGSEFPGQIRGGVPQIRTGVGSDVRFVDFSLMQRAGDNNLRIPLAYNQPYTFVDDAGGSFTVVINGGVALDNTSAMEIRSMPVDGSQGVAVARMSVNLAAGANLVITSLDARSRMSIGRIIVAADTPTSQILISGPGEIDVGRIDVVTGVIDTISNTTGRGDIVAIDAAALRNITIGTGSLGRTEVNGAGLALLGPFLGVAGGDGGAGAIGGPFTVPADAINQDRPGGGDGDNWDTGETFVPIDVRDYGSPSPLEDLGSPVDPWLNGVVVRNGDIQNVRVGGAVGDVIVSSGHIINLIANSDLTRPFGAFEGIVGNIYADVIVTIDIGDGLLGTGPSPFAAAGIFANDDIVTVTAVRVPNAVIQGAIIAANINTDPRTQAGTELPVNLARPVDGVGTVRLTGGRFDGALIQSVPIDDFWHSLRQTDENNFSGNVDQIIAVNSDLFRSEIKGIFVNNVSVTGGVYDSTTIEGRENVVLVTADRYLNSTRLGNEAEYHANRISSSNNLGSILASNLAVGNIEDLTVDVIGTITGRVAANNLVRLNLNVDNVINQISATTDAKSISIVSGRVRNFTVGRNLRASQLLIAGPVDVMTAGGEMTGLQILSSGPDGRIGTITANGRIDAEISASGPITSVTSTTSDISGRIETTDTDGSIGTLSAGRDLLIDARILGDMQTITVGRNVGRAEDLNDRALDVRGNLGGVTAVGQIFSDILVGQSITGTISSGRAVSKPGNDQVSRGDIVAFGSINALNFMGDFNGNISSLSGGIGTITITEGSFRQGRLIKALDGSIGTITISGGDLLGSIFTDGSIGSIQLLTGASGWLSQIGIATGKSNATSFDSFRNQLPPETNKTAAIDGPSIVAGQDITSIVLQRGSIWETTIRAGRTIGDITVNGGGIRKDNLTTGTASFITAGDAILKVSVAGNSDNAAFIAGLIGLGDDNAVGGTGSAADTIQSGSISQLTLNGKKNRNIKISAGLNAGADGVYNTTDDKRSIGVSSISGTSVRGPANSSAWADGPVTASGGSGLNIRRNGSGLGAIDPTLYSGITSGAVQVTNGIAFNFTTPNGQKGSILYTGAGRVFYDQSLNRVILNNTNSSTSLTIQARKNNNNNSNANLLDLSVLGSNNASLGSLRLNARLMGASQAFVDGGIGAFAANRLNSTGRYGSGGDVGSFNVNRWDRGHALGRDVGSFIVGGPFGQSTATGEASAAFLDLGVLQINGQMSGTISSDQNITSVALATVVAGGIRAGGNIGPVTAQSFNGAVISARDSITSLNVVGDSRDSAIYSGADLGRDASFGGDGANSDTVSNGTIGPVTIGGSFPESDIAAGVYRGPDGFLGTADDTASDGRSAIGAVTIAGQSVGSNINSEQYRVISTGSVGRVLVNNSDVAVRGNFAVRQLGALPVPVVVTDVNVFEDSRVYRAEFSFNQPIDASTFGPALSIVELRNSGATVVGLAQGTNADYTVRYDSTRNVGIVTFSRNVTDRSLPQQPGIPGPGLMRFVLSGAIFRGASQGVLLDGNLDGTTGDDFSIDAVVGDAGDKLVNGNPAGQPGIDFYQPVDLNLLLDSNFTSDNNPDVNASAFIRGTIGDHPDANSDIFRSGGDVDLYRISLRAGQVLRMGQITGVAQGAVRAIFNAAGAGLAANSPAGAQGGQAGAIIRLPNATNDDPTATSEDQYLVTVTGTYIIGIAATFDGVDISNVNNIPNNTPVGGAIGAYQFTIQVFDDGNTGFAGDTDSGDGTAVVNAPLPIQFAGADGQFGTTDDVPVFTTGRFNFTLNRGADGRPNTADDTVTGNDGAEVTSTRTVGADNAWGTSDDVVRTVVSSAIGLPGGVGVPAEIAPDADVFRLNNGQPIAPGTRVRITFRLTDTGGNIGLPREEITRGLEAVLNPRSDLLGDVQIALFETPSGTGFSDARLVASPSAFLPIGGQSPVTSTDGVNSYGYDASGDFFMEIVLPGSQGVTTTNVPAAYAVYVQGAVRSDYQLEILTQGTGNVRRSTQNILLETNGGQIDWLETSGLVTDLTAFTTSVLGFAGQINGVDVDDYVIQSLVSALNDIFTAANVSIVVSADAAAFEGQDFATVFIAGNAEPNAFFNNGEFGASEHVDVLNIDKNDEAVVFLSSLAVLGNDPSQAGVDNLVRGLTAAVGRRVGELIGLTITNPVASNASPVPIMASNSVIANPGPGGVYGFTNVNSTLSGLFDNAERTNFFLGTQNSLQLMQRILSPKA